MLALKQVNKITGLNLNQSDQSPWYSDHRSDYFVDKDGLIYAGAHLIIDMWDAINLSNREIIQNTLKKIAKACDAQILHIHLHSFDENQV